MARPALEADLGAVASLYHDVWHETHAAFMPVEESRLRTPAFFLERMRELLPTTLVAEREGMIAGFVAWKGSLLGQIFVAKGFRGAGLADSLMRAAEDRMAREGIRAAELHCAVGNERARRFYERMGWAHSGDASESVAGPDGPIAAQFWCMTKPLIPQRQDSDGRCGVLPIISARQEL